MTKNNSLDLLEYHLGEGVRAFSTGRGATDEGDDYSGFNVTHYCGDAPAHVASCRAKLCAELGISDGSLLLPRQVHETRILTVDDDFLKLSAPDRAACLDGVDALLTDLPRICIGISTADCVPLLLFDPEHRAVAAVHAGWRGTVKRMASLAVEAMRDRYATRPKSLRAVLGPSISQEAFEVGDEVYEAFREAAFPMSAIARKYPQAHSLLPETHSQFSPPNSPFQKNSPLSSLHSPLKWHLDLWAANCLCLEEAGVLLQNIQVCGRCTYAESDRFFSARRLGIRSGRIYNGIMLS